MQNFSTFAKTEMGGSFFKFNYDFGPTKKQNNFYNYFNLLILH